MFKTFSQHVHNIYKFDIKYKSKSFFMKLLGFLLFFNKGFIEYYITTIGSSIYFPSEEFIIKNEENSVVVLAHELVHVKQASYNKILFSFLYMFPQCLVLFAFLAPISLWFLLFLICLAPLPAPWRKKYEEEGFVMSLFVLNEILIRSNSKNIHERLVSEAVRIDREYFKGSAYWFMWPFGSNLMNTINDIETGVILGKDEIYGCVRQAYLNSVSS